MAIGVGFDDLQARVDAQEFILRTLFMAWVQGHPDPHRSILQFVEATIATMHAGLKNKDDDWLRHVARIETAVRAFGDTIEARLRAQSG